MQVNIMHAYACRQRKRYREAEKHLNAALAEARRMAPPAPGALGAPAGAGTAAKHQRAHASPVSPGALAAVQEADVTASPPSSLNMSAGSASEQPLLSLVRPSGVLPDSASTVASMQFASASEEVQQLVFRATVDLARCCFEQGRMQEAVRAALWPVMLVMPYGTATTAPAHNSGCLSKPVGLRRHDGIGATYWRLHLHQNWDLRMLPAMALLPLGRPPWAVQRLSRRVSPNAST